MSLIFAGQRVEVPGLVTRCYLDDPVLRLRIGQDGGNDGFTRRDEPLTLIAGHTTKGIPGGKDKRPQVILPGAGPPGAATIAARSWSTDREHAAGAQIIIDRDGSIACLCDLILEGGYHCVGLNRQSIGVEVYQGSGAEIYQAQIDSWVILCDALTRRLGIQRQIPTRYRNRALKRLLPLDKGGTAGRGVQGVIGHRDASDNRGAGDPGDAMMQALATAGYEVCIDDIGSDLVLWQQRQQVLGLAVDGIPGRKTRAALEAQGRPHGLWVSRPGDEEMSA